MREVYHLNDDWGFTPDFKEEYLNNECSISQFKRVDLPHNAVDLPYNNFDEKAYQIESCYKKTVFIPLDKKEKIITLLFGGVMAYAKVYVNGIFLASHKGGYTPFKVDITDAAVYGAQNIITVYVDSRERDEIPPFGFVIDYLTYSGIYREVSLEYTENVFIENCLVKPTCILEQEKQIDLDIYLDSRLKHEQDIQIAISLLKNDHVRLLAKRDIRISDETYQKISIKQSVKDVLLWDIKAPELYRLKLVLLKDGFPIDEKTYRFGFREAYFAPDGFYLNGKRIKLRGLNRHQSYPYVGYAMPKSVQYKDAEILKNELGVNIVRTAHYPQSDHFLDRCDELGILVFEEIPGWQHIGEKGEWWDIAKKNVEEMIRKDWNRPSIILWGTRINEAKDCRELFEQTNRIVKQLDDSRQTSGVTCIEGSHLIEDVYAYNDFIHDGKAQALNTRKKIAKKRVPYIISEHNGHMFSTKKFDNVQRRIEHALRHMRVLNAMYKDDEICGAIGWCMSDYNTHKEFGSGDKICYHGVMDMFRIEKYAAAVYASQQDEKPIMEIAQSLANGDMDNSTRGIVYVFTNCDYIALSVGDRYVNTFYPRKDLFPFVPHPPVVVDDFLGDIMEQNESFSKKDAHRIKRIMLKANEVGENLPLRDKIILGFLFLKYKMTMKDGRDLYTKYFGGWGTASSTYRFDGYIGDKCVLSKIKSQVFNPVLHMEADSNTLEHNETYDVTRITVRLKDEHGNDLYYGNDPILIQTDDKLELIGPAELPLIGGSIGFWVRTKGIEGESTIMVKSERFGVLAVKLIVNVTKGGRND